MVNMKSFRICAELVFQKDIALLQEMCDETSP